MYLYHWQSYGKVVYFITLFPYVVLTTFLIMGLQEVLIEFCSPFLFKSWFYSLRLPPRMVLPLVSLIITWTRTGNDSTTILTSGSMLAPRSGNILKKKKNILKIYTFHNQTQVSMFRFSTLWGLPTAPTFSFPRIIPSTATATGNLIKQYRYLNTATLIHESKENTDNKNYDYNNNEQI